MRTVRSIPGRSFRPKKRTRVAIRAFINGDTQALQTVLLDKSDVKQLGIAEPYAEKLLAATQDTALKLKTALRNSRSVNIQTTWMQFECSMPAVIPVDDGKADRDLTVYENAMVIVQTGSKTAFVQIGEMIRVGEVWKLTQIPLPLEGESVQVTAGGVLMQPALAMSNASQSGEADRISPETQRLLQQLQAIDQKSPPPNAAQTVIGTYNSQRTQILNKLILVAKTGNERSQWTRQMVDGLTTAVQTTGYAPGLEQLRSMEKDAQRSSADSALQAYIAYRRMLAEYSLGIQNATAKEQAAIQQRWQQQLARFVKDFPNAEDSPEAMLQLATSEEFHGKTLDAQNWYRQIMQMHPKARAAVRASGALRRLDLHGKPLRLSGPGLNNATIDVSHYRGRVLLVYYWATWCKPCTEDLPQIRALYEQYHRRGFEVIGVNLDSTDDPIRPFLAHQRITWPQIFQPGGLDSPPAQALGIFSLPTMFLVDKTGTVVNRNITVADLKAQLAKLLK